MGIERNQFYETILIITFIIVLILASFIVIIILHHRRCVKLQGERIFAEITIQESERKMISNNLHDKLGSLLS